LLYSIRSLAPDTVRVLLTGFGDVDAAMAAVNEGNIFRFLSKPCPSKTMIRALEASVEQHRLLTAQRVLLEQTLRASLRTLSDTLAIVNPVAFGRGLRTRKLISELAASDPVAIPWQAEIAAILAQISWVTLPAATASKLNSGKTLTASEQTLVDKLPSVTGELVGDIPRFEYIREILRHQDKHYDGQGFPPNGASGEAIPWGARALKAASDFDLLESRGCSAETAIEAMRARTGWYDPDILEAISRIRNHPSRDSKVLHLPLRAVQPGMVFAQEVMTRTGQLVFARGQEVTPSLLERVKNLALDSEVDQVVVELWQSGNGAP
jgi:response regulator RpfG family c-di-GMP phosphodiesterase